MRTELPLLHGASDTPRVRWLYAITFPNGKRYIGISFEPHERWLDHQREAARGNRGPLYRALRRYTAGIGFSVLAGGESSFIEELEVLAIAAWRTDRHAEGYNVAKGGGLGSSGLKASRETRAKMSRSHKGRKKSPEWIAKISEAKRGQKRSIESRARMSAGQKRRIRPPEELARMKEIAALAAQVRTTPEYREKARQSALRRWARDRQSGDTS